MEFNVRIVNLQLVDNNQAYEEIPPVLVLSISVKQITHTNEIDSNI
jgi:hypothetical protein